MAPTILANLPLLHSLKVLSNSAFHRYFSAVEKRKKRTKRKMVIPLPRVVYEEPAITFSNTRASKVKVIKGLDKENGEKARIYCEVCKHPIANRDSRVRYWKEGNDELLWRHAVCTSS